MVTFKEIMEARKDFQAELLPCPFCGGAPIVYCCDVKSVKFTAECYDCDLTLGNYPTLEKAAEAWNTRAPIKSPWESVARRFYAHLDTFGVVSGGSDREHQSQRECFDLYHEADKATRTTATPAHDKASEGEGQP